MFICADCSFQVLSKTVVLDGCCLCCWLGGFMAVVVDVDAWSRICTFAASLISLAMLASWCCWLRTVNSATSCWCWEEDCLVKLPLIRSVVREIFPSMLRCRCCWKWWWFIIWEGYYEVDAWCFDCCTAAAAEDDKSSDWVEDVEVCCKWWWW